MHSLGPLQLLSPRATYDLLKGLEWDPPLASTQLDRFLELHKVDLALCFVLDSCEDQIDISPCTLRVDNFTVDAEFGKNRPVNMLLIF